MSKDQDYYFAMDSETGGLDENVEDMLTFYCAIVTEDWKVVEEIYLKLKPNDGRFPIAHAKALAVNGIDLKKHMEDPETVTYAEGAKQVLALAAKYRKPGRWSNLVPLGHNVPFDIRFTLKHMIAPADWNKLLHYVLNDTKSSTDDLKRWGLLPPSLGSLGSLVEFFNIPQRAAHNAKEDTLMTIDVAKAMQAFMKSKKEGGTTQDLIALLEAE